jgi:hypothetical protein
MGHPFSYSISKALAPKARVPGRPVPPEARTPGRLVPAGDGGDDAERVGCGYGGCFFLWQVAHIFIVQVEVNEGANFALGGEKVIAQIGMRMREAGESVGDCAGVDLDFFLTAWG